MDEEMTAMHDHDKEKDVRYPDTEEDSQISEILDLDQESEEEDISNDQSKTENLEDNENDGLDELVDGDVVEDSNDGHQEYADIEADNDQVPCSDDPGITSSKENSPDDKASRKRKPGENEKSYLEILLTQTGEEKKKKKRGKPKKEGGPTKKETEQMVAAWKKQIRKGGIPTYPILASTPAVSRTGSPDGNPPTNQMLWTRPPSPIEPPPEATVKLHTINPLLTCFICKGYLVNPATITECLHSFCKSCLVRHVYDVSTFCPKCKTLIHPWNPFVNMRLDGTMQDIVHKLLPQVEKDERGREEKFYTSRGLPWPPLEVGDDIQDKWKNKRGKYFKGGRPFPAWISVLLEYVGTSPEIGDYEDLKKKYLRLPGGATIRHLQTYIGTKVSITAKSQVSLFYESSMIHETLTLEDVWFMFYETQDHLEDDLIVLRYGIVPRKNYFEDVDMFDELLLLDSETLARKTEPVK